MRKLGFLPLLMILLLASGCAHRYYTEEDISAKATMARAERAIQRNEARVTQNIR